MMVSRFSNPLVTPVTMLFTSARIVPETARARLLSARRSKRNCAPSWVTFTRGCTAYSRLPLGPFTLTWLPLSLTSTPPGMVTGFFAILDMFALSPRPASGNDAQHFAAEAGLARGAIGHDPFGRGDDRHARAAEDARQPVLGPILTQAGRAHALDALDHPPALEILERDLQRRFTGVADLAPVLDIALVLEHLRDGALDARGRHAHADLLGLLAVADAGQHV